MMRIQLPAVREKEINKTISVLIFNIDVVLYFFGSRELFDNAAFTLNAIWSATTVKTAKF